MTHSYVSEYVNEICEEMKLQSITITEMSGRLGVTRVTLSRFLNKHSNMTFEHIEAVAEQLGMKPVLCLMDKDD